MDLMAQSYSEDVWLMIVLAVRADDMVTIEATDKIRRLIRNERAEVVRILRQADSSAVDGWNLAYDYASRSGADWFVLGADDIRFQDGWLAEALKVAEETGAQVIGLSDGGHTDVDIYAPHYMASRQFTEDFNSGYMAPPMYQAWWFDREICEKAQYEGLYAPAPLAVAEHRHPNWDLAPVDETYRLGQQYHEADKQIYKQRRAAGYPAEQRLDCVYSGISFLDGGDGDSSSRPHQERWAGTRPAPTTNKVMDQ